MVRSRLDLATVPVVCSSPVPRRSKIEVGGEQNLEPDGAILLPPGGRDRIRTSRAGSLGLPAVTRTRPPDEEPEPGFEPGT